MSVSPAGAWTRYETAPTGSLVHVEGDSTVHRWHVKGVVITGELAAAESFFLTQPGVGQSLDVSNAVEISVKSLSSGKAGMDRVMYKAMKEEEFPAVTYRMLRCVIAESEGADTLALATVGELTCAGVTRELPIGMKLERAGDQQLLLTGSVSMKMTEFKIKPPTAMMNLIKSADDITVSFEWRIQPKL